MESNSILYYLDNISDKRRAEGKRHPHKFVLILIIMATMSRYFGYRGIARFISKNRNVLIEKFNPKDDRLPSLATIRRVIMNLDFEELVEQFHDWARQYVDVSQDEWLSIDGKALKGTVGDCSSSHQNFVSIVSAYAQRSDVVLSIDKYETKKVSEIGTVETMISTLGLTGVTFTMDALHCQKNSKNN